MPTLQQLLKSKGRQVHSTTAQVTITNAAQQMNDLRIGALVVLDDDGSLEGIITERDLMRVIASSKAPSETTVAEAMTRKLTTISPQDTAEHALQLMTNGRIRHLPVLEQGQLVALISIGDLVKMQLGEQKEQIDQLNAYITGVPDLQ